MKNIIALFTILLTTSLIAQDHFIIENVRLFDGETVKENVSVHIENGFIKQVSKRKIKTKKIKRINGEEKTLMPGLTNAHVHVWSQASLQEAAKAGVLNVLGYAWR